MKKRAKTYDKPMVLKDGVKFDDLIKVSLKPQKQAPKARRAKVKK